MKVHVLGLPHTVTSKDFTTCAFTQKVLKLCAMLSRRGHEVIHYGVEGSDVEGAHVSIISNKRWKKAYPHPETKFYNHGDVSGPRGAYVEAWTRALARELRKRVGDPWTEIIAMTWGGPQRRAVEGLAQFEVESGIGYPISWANYRVYESYAWLHMHMGRDNLFHGSTWYWSVIPNAFDMNEFEFGRGNREGFLYLGRLIDSKGVKLACDIAKAAGKRITICGQGDPTPFLAPHVSYHPPVGVEERKKLLASAEALLCPTHFVEPFCGVAVEAMLSGTPVITTDWGAVTETVLHGLTGYRCRTMDQFIWAARNIDRINPQTCRRWAEENYSLQRVAPMYEEFFQMVLDLKDKGAGFDKLRPERTELDWLARSYPPNLPVHALRELKASNG